MYVSKLWLVRMIPLETISQTADPVIGLKLDI